MGRKKHPEHENLERWLVSYADFITLLFAFFVVLWATGQADQEKLKKAMGAMNDAFGGGMSRAILDVLSLGTHESGLPASHLAEDTVTQPELDNLMRNLRGSLSDHTVQIGLVEQKLTLVLPELVLFGTGSASIHPVAYGMLGDIATALSTSNTQIQVIGHADGLPMPPGSAFEDNWTLATARAVAAVRYLEAHGVARERLVASGTTSAAIDPNARAVKLVVMASELGAAHDIIERLGETEVGKKLQGEPPAERPPAELPPAAPAPEEIPPRGEVPAH